MNASWTCQRACREMSSCARTGFDSGESCPQWLAQAPDVAGRDSPACRVVALATSTNEVLAQGDIDEQIRLLQADVHDFE